MQASKWYEPQYKSRFISDGFKDYETVAGLTNIRALTVYRKNNTLAEWQIAKEKK